jgi:hypothetical protein
MGIDMDLCKVEKSITWFVVAAMCLAFYTAVTVGFYFFN